MKVSSIKKVILLAGCILLSSFHSVMADGTPESLNLDHFRTPEASAFKKYGEESVNEYTGTADISVPLYTIKCKDIEIPIVLRYDASGIKVEQEASWVGLGWNLTVGGCINYVCAGGHDMYNAPDIPNNVWTEYLTSEFTFSTYGNIQYKNQTRYYVYNSNDDFNWMARLPLRPQDFVLSYTDYIGGGYGMKEYVDWGYGERDFYSVNVMGKSFLFFIDPFTLNVYNIGKAGEDFIVEPEYQFNAQTGIGNQPDITRWTITDSDGYVYSFEEGDKFQCDSQTGARYTSCWYLTKIKSPTGEEVVFKYGSLTRAGRTTRFESYRLPIPHGGGLSCCSNVSQPTYNSSIQSVNSNTNVTSHYLTEIKAGNQTVTFVTSTSNECSGRKLDGITVSSKDNTTVKNIVFSYDSFGYSNVGGNYAPAAGTDSEYRLKLVNVSEIASQDTLKTSFSYNSQQLPSKRSCAQDFWGYYNGRENNVQGRGYSLLPPPQKFMSSNYTQALDNYSIKGADRYSRDSYMQAAMLNRVDYPTGGYTTYEYEPNSILTRDFTLTEKYREKQYDISVLARFSCYRDQYNHLVADQSEQRKDFTLTQEGTCDLLLQCSGNEQLLGQDIHIQIYRQNNTLVESDTVSFIPYSQEPSRIRSVTLPAGSYYLLVIPVGNGYNQPFYIRCYLKGWYEETLSQTFYTLTCGGLRVKKISNFDHGGGMINYITYDYNANGMTSGKLLDKIETIDFAHCYNMEPVGGLPGTHDVEVYTINTGHSRLPSFFSSCNPGIVGYSKVTKSKYDAAGHLEKRVITSYTNNEPQHMYSMDYYMSFDNGQVLSQEIRDASNAVVARTENTYANNMVDHYATNMVVKYKCLNHGPSALASSLILVVYNAPSTTPTSTTNLGNPGTEGVVDVWRYPYILSRAELSRSVSTEYCQDGSTIVRRKDYLYNGINHQVSRIDENTGLSNQTRRTRITYSADATDDVSTWMRNAHRLNDVVETKNILVVNGQERCQSTQRTNFISRYVNGASRYLPGSSSRSIGNNASETRTVYSYDDSLNVKSVAVDSIETVYIWSYKGQYPIARIEGLRHAEVETALGSTISALLCKAVPSQADYNSIRTAVKALGGHITTYTYKPLVGITSETLPNGNRIYYEYDGFGRLARVLDHNGSVISTNSYNYRKQ